MPDRSPSPLCRAFRTLLLLVALLVPAAAPAQAVGAALEGVVSDATGSTVASADVVLVATATGATVELKTDANGRYLFPLLAPGPYEVHVTRQGFQPTIRR